MARESNDSGFLTDNDEEAPTNNDNSNVNDDSNRNDNGNNNPEEVTTLTVNITKLISALGAAGGDDDNNNPPIQYGPHGGPMLDPFPRLVAPSRQAGRDDIEANEKVEKEALVESAVLLSYDCLADHYSLFRMKQMAVTAQNKKGPSNEERETDEDTDSDGGYANRSYEDDGLQGGGGGGDAEGDDTSDEEVDNMLAAVANIRIRSPSPPPTTCDGSVGQEDDSDDRQSDRGHNTREEYANCNGIRNSAGTNQNETDLDDTDQDDTDQDDTDQDDNNQDDTDQDDTDQDDTDQDDTDQDDTNQDDATEDDNQVRSNGGVIIEPNCPLPPLSFASSAAAADEDAISPAPPHHPASPTFGQPAPRDLLASPIFTQPAPLDLLASPMFTQPGPLHLLASFLLSQPASPPPAVNSNAPFVPVVYAHVVEPTKHSFQELLAFNDYVIRLMPFFSPEVRHQLEEWLTNQMMTVALPQI